VAWKDVSGAISGKGVLQACVMGTVEDDNVGNKVIVPEHKVMLIQTGTEDEAHYLAAILNSSVLRLLVASYTMERQIGSHLTQYARIPKFDENNEVHQKLVKCSKKAHSLDPTKRSNIQSRIDNLVAHKTVFGLTKKEIKQVRKDLQLLLE
jgi:hypothetical protein